MGKQDYISYNLLLYYCYIRISSTFCFTIEENICFNLIFTIFQITDGVDGVWVDSWHVVIYNYISCIHLTPT